jgi:5-methylcytosine-specific restriction endonuclease McrA
LIAFTRAGIPADCPLLPQLRDHVDGECDRCSKALTGRQKRWCSTKCATWAWKAFARHHDWNDARKAALKRDRRRCVRCGANERQVPVGRRGRMRSNLSVNHIVPRRGKGYGRGCHHHLDNLETLCDWCHPETTRQQNAQHRKAS